MILSMQIMETMVDNVEFVRELIKIIKNVSRVAVGAHLKTRKKVNLLIIPPAKEKYK